MSSIVSEGIEEYIQSLANRGDDFLRELEATGLRDDWPIVGAAEGSLLHILAKSLKAKRILELGTAIGYSGIWLAMGLEKGGELITVEWDEETARLAEENFEKAGISSRVHVVVGSADRVLKDLRGPFDMIFNDIDKQCYPLVLEGCIRLLRIGGLLVTDNVLWKGAVVKGGDDDRAEAIREYNRRLSVDCRLITVIVPLRDGVSISLKIRES